MGIADVDWRLQIGGHAIRKERLNYNDGMLALRFAGLLAVAVWFGGLVALGAIAAPAIFDVTASGRVAGGRMAAGALFGEILGRFHLVGYACGAVLLLSLSARAVLGPRPRHFALAAATTSLMLAAALYSGMVLSGRIEHLREEIGEVPSSLPENDPRRVEFGRLHAQSTAFQLVPLFGGLVLLFREMTDCEKL